MTTTNTDYKSDIETAYTERISNMENINYLKNMVCSSSQSNTGDDIISDSESESDSETTLCTCNIGSLQDLWNNETFSLLLNPDLKSEDVLSAVRTCGLNIVNAPCELRSDPNLILIALKTHDDLWHIMPHILEIRKVLMYILKRKDVCPYRIPSKFKQDRELLLCALSNDWDDYCKDVDSELLNDRAFVLKMIKRNYKIFSYISSELKNDIPFVIQAIQTEQLISEFVPLEIARSKRVIHEMLTFEKLKATLQNEVEKSYIISLYTKKYEFGIEKNKYFTEAALHETNTMIDCCIGALYKHIIIPYVKDMETAKFVLERNSLVIGHLEPMYSSNKQLALIAVQQNYYSFLYMDTQMQMDIDIATIVLKKDPNFIWFIVPILQSHPNLLDIIPNLKTTIGVILQKNDHTTCDISKEYCEE